MDVKKVYPIPEPHGSQKTLPFTWPRMLQYTIKGGQKPYFLVKVHYGIGENGQFRDMKQDIFFAATKRRGADSLWRCCGVHGSLTSVTLLSLG